MEYVLINTTSGSFMKYGLYKQVYEIVVLIRFYSNVYLQ